MRSPAFVHPVRLGSVSICIACFVLGPRLLFANLAPSSAAPASDPSVNSNPAAPTSFSSLEASITIEVEISSTIPDAQALSDWIHEGGSEALRQLSPPPTNPGTIRVTVSGDLYDYEVAISFLRKGSISESTVTWPCECTNEELIARIRTGIQTAVTESVDASNTEKVFSEQLPSEMPRRPQLRRKLGIGLIVGGAAGTLAGVVLLGVGRRTYEDPRDAAYRYYEDYRVPGVPAFLVGVGLLAAGTTLFVLDRRQRGARRLFARTRPIVSLTHHGSGFGVVGSF